MKIPKSFDEFYQQREGRFSHLLLLLDAEIRRILPGVEVKFKWGGPHYFEKGHLGYINPDLKTGEVYIGFIRGYELSDFHGLLRNDGDTTMIKKLYIKDENDLRDKSNAIRETLMEAVLLNELNPKTRAKRREDAKANNTSTD